MKIHELAIKRPITVLMCVLIVLVLGFTSLLKVSIDLIPNINFPMAIVMTTYSGAGPEEIENSVTKNIENAIASVSNIKTIQSQSSTGTSIVIAEFSSNTDMDFAALQMREKIDLYKALLPSDAGDPMVIKVDPSMMPVAYMGITGDMDDTKLKNFVEDKIKQKMESLDGVASVSIMGGKTREIRVEANPEKLAGYGMGLSQVVSVLQTENINQAAGAVDYGDKTLIIKNSGEFESLEQIKNLPIILPTGNVISIKDVAEVKDSYEEVTSYTRMQTGESIGLTVQKQSGVNTVQVVNKVKEAIEGIQKANPEIKIEMVFDQGKYIEQSIGNVAKDGIIGCILAVIILFLFLKNIRATLIVGTAIPLSIIATFILIYFSGTTLNLISLGGLMLGIGRLVDDAIVVLENIYRHMDQGYDRVKASVTATAEVGRAVIASTLTTVIVFLPIAFAEGIAAQMFKELALVIAFSLCASLVVALTVIPTLSSKFLTNTKIAVDAENKPKRGILAWWESTFNRVTEGYGKILQYVINHKKGTIFAAIIIFVGSLAMIPIVGAEYFPSMDQGQFTVDIGMPQGSLLERTNEVTLYVEKTLKDIPELEKYFVSVGSASSGMNALSGSQSNSASINVTLKAINKRDRTTAEIVDELRNKFAVIPGTEITVTEASSSMSGSTMSSAISVQINGTDLKLLKELADKVTEIVKKVEGTRQVESSVAKGKPEAEIIVNRDRASLFGLGSYQIASTVRNSIAGKVATTYKVDGEEYDIRVELPEDARKNFEQLKSIKVMSAIGTEIPLSDLAEIRIQEGPTSIMREGQQRYVTVNSDIFGRYVGNVSADIKKELKDFALPEGYSIEFGGEDKEMIEAFGSLLIALILGFLLVYMVMASQFESLIHPFTIMFSVPLAFTGAALGLVLTGRAFSVPAFIGAIMLMGIVVSNAIVLVDYINKLRERGLEREEAILKAGPTRLRPIVMTSLVTILAMFPLALGFGEGGEIQAPLATVVIGGMISSTILTLVVVPVIYILFDDLGLKIKRKFKKEVQIGTVDKWVNI